MTLLIVLACIAVYLGIGFRYFAPRFVTRSVASHIRRYPHSAQDPREIERWRREAAGEAIVLAFVLPIYLPVSLLLGWLLNRISNAAPLTDHELRRKAEAQAERIAHLERQLGMTGKQEVQ